MTQPLLQSAATAARSVARAARPLVLAAAAAASVACKRFAGGSGRGSSSSSAIAGAWTSPDGLFTVHHPPELAVRQPSSRTVLLSDKRSEGRDEAISVTWVDKPTTTDV